VVALASTTRDRMLFGNTADANGASTVASNGYDMRPIGFAQTGPTVPSQEMIGASPPPVVWAAYQDAQGRMYYHNVQTGETVYAQPQGMKNASFAGPNPMPTPTPSPLSAPRAMWAAYKDAQGRVYYHNAHTGETQWTAPAAPLDPGMAIITPP
jgi:hypothetical protein